MKVLLIEDAVAKLKNGEVVAVPTETVYGLAADIANPSALAKIFKVKGRPFFDPLIVHISTFEQLSGVACEISPLALKIAKKFWPGPLTLILPKHPKLNRIITAGHDTVGVRMPRHPQTLKIITQLGSPIAAPSANKFGRTSPTTASHVYQEFGDTVAVLDGGACEIGLESTVIEVHNKTGDIFIYRPGAVTAEMLAEFGTPILKNSPVAPGHLNHHYQPSRPLVWFKSSANPAPELYEHIKRQLNISPPYSTLYPKWIQLNFDPAIAARELYASLRQADTLPNINCLFLGTCPAANDRDFWPAIFDRLNKAATMIL